MNTIIGFILTILVCFVSGFIIGVIYTSSHMYRKDEVEDLIHNNEYEKLKKEVLDK